MKSPILKIALSALFALSLSFLISCEKDTPGGSGGGGGPQPPACGNYGTFTRVLCGASIYDNYWIQMDDGSFLQPCETDVVTLCPLPIQEGTRIKFGYKKITGPSSCDNIITCKALDPRVTSSKKVKITCIEITRQPAQCEYVGTVMYHQGCNVKYLQQDNNGDRFEPVDQSLMNQHPAGEKVLFSYHPVYTFRATCSGAAPVQLTCITKMADPPPASECRPITIGDDPIRPQAVPAVTVLKASIEGNCLKLSIGFSGCDGNTDRIAMIWDGMLSELIPEANLILTDLNPQVCDAYFTKDVSFDLSVLKQKQPGSIVIRIAGWEGSLIY